MIDDGGGREPLIPNPPCLPLEQIRQIIQRFCRSSCKNVSPGSSFGSPSGEYGRAGLC